LLQRWTDSLNLWLAVAVLRLFEVAVLRSARDPATRELLASAQSPDGGPEERYAYLYGLAWAWIFPAPVVGVLGAGIGYVEHWLNGNTHTNQIIAITSFAFGFCIAGCIDAGWRFCLVQTARRRYRRAGRILDDQSRRLVKLSRLNDRTLLLQLAAGALLAWRS
jgi:hypothetical protein